MSWWASKRRPHCRRMGCSSYLGQRGQRHCWLLVLLDSRWSSPAGDWQSPPDCVLVVSQPQTCQNWPRRPKRQGPAEQSTSAIDLMCSGFPRSRFGSLLLFCLLTESMSSIVSANSGMVCRVERTVLASTARNLLGETGSCGGGPCGISGPCQDRLSSSSCGLLQPVVIASSDTLSGHVVYSSWRGKNDMGELNLGKTEFLWRKINYRMSMIRQDQMWKFCLSDTKQENKEWHSMEVEVRIKGI